jgi:teichuronic acid biosynthesis glycosyltransferase TuaG
MNMYEWIESLDKDMISIVIPTFNRPIFLGTALQSLVEQINPPKFEVIVVDDGSTIENYGANEIICEHYFNYLDLRLIGLSKNSGTVSIPRNIGISHINGRTIAPMDDDCLAKPNKLRVLFDEINKLKMMWVPFVFGNREECRIVNGLLQVIRTPDSGSHMPKDVGLDNGQFVYRA